MYIMGFHYKIIGIIFASNSDWIEKSRRKVVKKAGMD